MTEEFADIVFFSSLFLILSAFAGAKNAHIVPAASKYVQVHFLFHEIYFSNIKLDSSFAL
jgi:hypothetical protein